MGPPMHLGTRPEFIKASHGRVVMEAEIVCPTTDKDQTRGPQTRGPAAEHCFVLAPSHPPTPDHFSENTAHWILGAAQLPEDEQPRANLLLAQKCSSVTDWEPGACLALRAAIRPSSVPLGEHEVVGHPGEAGGHSVTGKADLGHVRSGSLGCVGRDACQNAAGIKGNGLELQCDCAAQQAPAQQQVIVSDR
ncbi:hypothetical protein INR49_028728 [Caranx melampygus]|nr:hypothetical protein INR49_028728 [Caranx melampygus]